MINSRRCNTKPSTPPEHYSDCWHMDIEYGPCTSIGGICFCLLLVDQATRYKRIYPLKNLTTSLLRAMKRFLTDVKVAPKITRKDFDHKLIGGPVSELLQETNKIDLQAAPPKRQHQNGLVERSWQTIVSMT